MDTCFKFLLVGAFHKIFYTNGKDFFRRNEHSNYITNCKISTRRTIPLLNCLYDCCWQILGRKPIPIRVYFPIIGEPKPKTCDERFNTFFCITCFAHAVKCKNTRRGIFEKILFVESF